MGKSAIMAWGAVLALCSGGAVACIACSDAVANPTGEPAKAPAVPRPVAPAKVAAAQVVPLQSAMAQAQPDSAGALTKGRALHRFFGALDKLDEGLTHDHVRIVQLGDSHTAADIGTASARRALQARFGDGGRGFVAIGRPWKGYLQEGVKTGMTHEWSMVHGKLDHGKFVGDGLYGLGGGSVVAARAGGRAFAELSAKTSRLEIDYLEHPRGGSFDVYVDGTKAVRLTSKAATPQSAFHAIDVSEGPHHVEIRNAGDGEVRVYGVVAARSTPGIQLDALGINGARAVGMLHWSESHMAEQLRHRAPDLVVLAYGTNESTDDTSPEAYERQLVDVLGRVARAVPTASCLLLGPPDRAVESREGWITAPKLLEVVRVQKRVAEAAGCAFYDQMEAMGGEGVIAAWSLEDPPRAQKDRVHLTRDGYAQLGASFASDVMRAYAAWRIERGAPLVPRATQPDVAAR